MCDTFAPLYPTKAALAYDDLNYPKSWETGWTPEERAATAATNGTANGNGHANGNGAAKKSAKTAKKGGRVTVEAKSKAKPAAGAAAASRGKSANTWG